MKHLTMILFTGHCGSSWLLSLLSGHSRVGQIGFEPVDTIDKQLEQPAAPFFRIFRTTGDPEQLPPRIRKIFAREMSGKGPGTRFDPALDHFVFKSRPMVASQTDMFAGEALDGAMSLILLRRRNKLKTAVSQFKRSHLDISHLTAFDQAETKRRPVRVDADLIYDLVKKFSRRELVGYCVYERLTAHGLKGTQILYEDLLDPAGRDAILADTFRLIGVEPEPVRSDYTKMTSDSLADAVENYQELVDRFTGTRFEGFLADDAFDPVLDIMQGAREADPLWPAELCQKLDKALQARAA